MTVDDPSVAITTVEELRAWIPLRIREKGNASVRQSTRRQPSTSERPPSAPTATVPSAAVIAAPPPAAPALTLSSLLPAGAKGFAVFDLETTGTAHSSRIVEIALVKLDAQGRITEEWETLVNPAVPIPNAQIHGVSAVSSPHLRAHETVLDLGCSLLLEKNNSYPSHIHIH